MGLMRYLKRLRTAKRATGAARALAAAAAEDILGDDQVHTARQALEKATATELKALLPGFRHVELQDEPQRTEHMMGVPDNHDLCLETLMRIDRNVERLVQDQLG